MTQQEELNAEVLEGVDVRLKKMQMVRAGKIADKNLFPNANRHTRRIVAKRAKATVKQRVKMRQQQLKDA